MKLLIYGANARNKYNYRREVEKMTHYYETVNANAETITRKATPEENEYYLRLLERAKRENKIYDDEKRRYYKYGNIN